MDIDRLQRYLINKTGTVEDYPFGPDTLVYKVMGKMFALISWKKEPLQLNLKSDPDTAMILRNLHEAIIPGYHMNKKHWNTVLLDETLCTW